MKRPLCVFAAAFLLHTGAFFFGGKLLAAAVPAVGGIWCLLFFRSRSSNAYALALCLLAGSLGSLLASQCFLIRTQQFQALSGQTLSFEGYVNESGAYGSGTAVIWARIPGLGHRVLQASLQPGEAEPGDLVEGRFLVRGIRSDAGEVPVSGGLILTGRVEELQLLEESRNIPLLWRIMGIRRALFEQVRLAVPGPNGGLLAGMLFSIRDGIPDSIAYPLDDAGLSHILSVSGLHLSILSGLLLGLCRHLRLRPGVTLLLCSAGVAVMVVAAGFALSVLRAGIMTLLYLAAQTVGRRSDGLTSLALAAVLLCAFYPPALGETGFQLSFAATLAILFLARPLSRWFLDRWVALRGKAGVPSRWAAGTLSVCCAAQIGVMPILGFLNGYLPTYSIAANLLAAPLIFAALAMGLTGSCLLLVGLDLVAAPMLRAASLPCGLLAGLGKLCRALPLTRLPVYQDWARALMLLTVCVAAAAGCLTLSPPARRTLLRLWAAVLAVSCLIFPFSRSGSVMVVTNPEARAITLTGPEGTLMVYDLTDRGSYEARMVTQMLTRSGLGVPQRSLPLQGGVMSGFSARQLLPGVRVGMPHTYATTIEIGSIKVLKFWAGYDIIVQYGSRGLWEEADLIADVEWNLYARNPEITIHRRNTGDQIAVLSRKLVWKGGGGGAASGPQKAVRSG